MRPQDVEGLRLLRIEAGRALQAAEAFEKEKSTPPEETAELSPEERFNALWDSLSDHIDPSMTATDSDNAVTHQRLVFVGDDDTYSMYGLHFEMSDIIAGYRMITAHWNCHQSVSTTGEQETTYEYKEGASERAYSVAATDQLANLETSMQAFLEAEPFTSVID